PAADEVSAVRVCTQRHSGVPIDARRFALCASDPSCVRAARAGRDYDDLRMVVLCVDADLRRPNPAPWCERLRLVTLLQRSWRVDGWIDPGSDHGQIPAA